MKRILMILTSRQQMENTDSKTGVWLGEFTDPYYEFIDQFKSALLPFVVNLETDGLLITGQNPLSAGPVAKAIIQVLDTTVVQAT